MANNYFQFKQFKVTQENAAMKVGTDGVLLGAWTDCSNASSILDIGTGTGLIALMLAQRCKAKITGIDLDENAIADATTNIKNSPWSQQISIQNISIQNFTSSQKFDLIISNPPFFENSLKAESKSRTTARHTDLLSTEDLLMNTAKHLKENGKCCFVIPAESHELYLKYSELYGLYIHKTLWVKPTPVKPAKRVLVEFTKTKMEHESDTLIVEEFGRHKYSKSYIDLTKDFYLKM